MASFSSKKIQLSTLPLLSSPKLLQYLILLTTLLAVGLSIVPYFIIRKYQAINQEQEFQSSTKENYNIIKSLLNVQVHLNLQFSWNLGTGAPLKAYWPNIPIPFYNMRSSTLQLVAISQVREFLIAPIVAPDQRKSFEAVAKNYYAHDGNYPPGTGSSEFGFGIFDVDADGTHVRSPNHTDPSLAHHDFLIPLFTTSSNKSVDHLLSNSYSDGTIQTVDDVFECFNTSEGSPQHRQHSCSTIMNFPVFGNDDISGLSTPIYPVKQPQFIVAFMVSLFSWQTLLQSSIRESSNFQCVIESTDRNIAFKYDIKNGVIRKVDDILPGDPTNFFSKALKRSYIINLEGLSPQSTVFTITYYSSPHENSSQFLPLIALFTCFALTLFVSVIFICVIFLLRRETFAAQRLLEAKRIYVRFISHEIRTPLNTIKLSVQLLARNFTRFQDILRQHLPSGDKSMNEINHILEESMELLIGLEENSSISVTTLNDLINYDKIETNSFRIEKNVVNIWSLLEKTLQPMSFLAKEKNICMTMISHISEPSQFPESNIDLQSLYVFGDSIKIEQVIRNLISNALKFTPIGGEVKISAYFQEQDINHDNRLGNRSYTQISDATEEDHPHQVVGSIVISVADTGPGLSLEQQNSMFFEGVQFNPNELQAGQGSGLGLWISKEIVRRHHGTIRVTSPGLGLGATFEVLLPVYYTRDTQIVAKEVDESSQVLVVSPHGEPSVSLGCTESTVPPTVETPQIESASEPHSQPRVLVVDDTPSCRKIVSRLLKTKGFVCSEAENGKVCVDMVVSAEEPYDLILLDFEMPVMNGPAAAQKLRDMKYDVLIVGLTGNVLPEDKEYFLNSGANLVLFKPLHLPDLLNYFNDYRSCESKV